jgi:hypothetical protein
MINRAKGVKIADRGNMKTSLLLPLSVMGYKPAGKTSEIRVLRKKPACKAG